MKTRLIAVCLLLLLAIIGIALWNAPAVHGQSQSGGPNAIGVNSNITQIGGVSVNTDPCGSWGVVKQSKAINISSATTTAVVAVSGSTAVFVCGFELQTVSGTTPTFQFEYGTGTACASGATALTGTWTGAALQTFFYGGGEMTIFAGPASNGVCIVSGGTSPNVQGIVTFVQQ